ncbi:type II toxin-antitoxin system HigB family toxin [bacterium]|nr:type II toxin-antitoxin system HigB family toxin [bacterium]
MLLLGKQLIDDFKKNHASLRNALDRWVQLVESAVITKPEDFKSVFGKRFDKVGDKYVFDVGGNKVRVICITNFGISVLQVTDVLTHKEYDKGKWKYYGN